MSTVWPHERRPLSSSLSTVEGGCVKGFGGSERGGCPYLSFALLRCTASHPALIRKPFSLLLQSPNAQVEHVKTMHACQDEKIARDLAARRKTSLSGGSPPKLE